MMQLGQEEKVILGYPWLTAHNSQIDWISGEIKLKGNTISCLPMGSMKTPQFQQLSRIHSYCWIMLPCQVTRETLWRMNSDKWKLELQPEEFTNEPHQALINQGNSLIPIYDMV